MRLLTPLLRVMSRSGDRARLSVLIFHRVLPEPDPLFPEEMHARRFDELCGWLASWFKVLALEEAVKHLKAGTLPAGAASITFDDGYADNYHVALPILQRHGLSATFFIATGFLDGGRMWNDTVIESVRQSKFSGVDLSALGLGDHSIESLDQKRAAIASLIGQIKYLGVEERIAVTEALAQVAKVRPPENLMMTSHEVKAMRLAGMQIGAHTISHPILAGLEDGQARREISGSKSFLERLLGERIGLFAYPNGKPNEDFSPQTVAVVRGLDFDAAVSTQWGASSKRDDMFQIRRFTPWDKTRSRFGLRMLANLRNA